MTKEDVVRSMLSSTKNDIEAEQRVVEECCEKIAREMEEFNMYCSAERIAEYSRTMLEAANRLRELREKQREIEFIVEHFDILAESEREDNDNDEK